MILFFDLDGPILDVANRHYQVYKKLVIDQDGCPISQAEYWAYKRQKAEESLLLQVSQIKDGSAYRQGFKQQIEMPIALESDRVWTGVAEMLRSLSSYFPLVVVTLRHSRSALDWQLQTLGLLPYFSQVLSGSDIKFSGDQPSIKVNLVRNALGDQSLSGWFIGDTETDITAGQRLGLKTVAVTFGIRTAEILIKTNPDLLIHSPQEIIDWATDLILTQATSLR